MAEEVILNGERCRNETQDENIGKKSVDKYVYIALAVFLGWCGIHRFYAGKTLAGVLSVLFFWTCIPELIAIFDIIKASGKMKDVNNRIWI